MPYRSTPVLSLLALALMIAGCAHPPMHSPLTLLHFNVRDFGATGNGTTKDTAALQKTLDACAVAGGGEVLVPPGNYLTGSLQLGQRTTLRLTDGATLTGSPDLADYPMVDVRWEGRWQPGHRALISAADVDDIAILGPGHIEGNAQVAAPQNPRAVILETRNCHHVTWENFSITQGGNWATHPTFSSNIVVRNVSITGKRDGIDVDSCDHVLIDHCTLDTGDDSISLKSGRGMDGARVGRPTSDVHITNCTLIGRNFACLGIGSETSGGVDNITIDHCTMTAARDCIYIKTRIGRAGTTQNIRGTNLTITGGGFLRINLTSAGNTNTADDPVPGLPGYPIASNLFFSEIHLDHATMIADVSKVAPERPVTGLTLQHITGTAAWGIGLVHVRNAVIADIRVDGMKGPALGIDDVTGTGLEHAEKYQAPPAPPSRRRPTTGPATSRPASATPQSPPA